MNFTSYAQNFEDVLLLRALRDVRCGRYLDIGAQDPVEDSVSLAFYRAGWRGVHIEPTQFYADRLREERPDEIVIQAAVTDKQGPTRIYEIPGTGLSTGIAEIAAEHELNGYVLHPSFVPSVRLDHILEMTPDDIHWMKIDVEGMESEVLASWGESIVRPWVLVIEATYPNSPELTDHLWMHHVHERNYRAVHFDGLSRFFVHEDHSGLADVFSSSPNIFDGFSITPRHFAAQEITERFDDQLANERMEAARREEELNSSLSEMREQAETSSDLARVAINECEGERANSVIVQAQLEVAMREHQLALDSLAAERDRMREMSERLTAAEREHREVVVRTILDFRLAEFEKDGEARARENDLNSALRKAEAEASALHAAALERIIVTEQEHRSVLDNFHSTQQAAEAELRHQIRDARDDLEAARAHALRLTEELAHVSAQRAETHAELMQLRTEVAQASRDRSNASAKEASLLIEIAEARKEREYARDKARRVRAAAQQADAIVKSVLRQQNGLWQKIGRYLGLSHPRGAWSRLASVSVLLTDHQQSTAANVHQRAQEREPTMPTCAQGITTNALEECETLLPSSAQSAEPNPYLRADSLEELLSWHGLDFVRCVYVTILGRQPDPEGEATYLARLRAGVSKKTIVRQLRNCPEGRLHDPGIAGLDRELRRHGNATHPFVGWLVRAMTSREGDTRSDRQARIFQASVRDLEANYVHLSHDAAKAAAASGDKIGHMARHLELSFAGLSTRLINQEASINEVQRGVDEVLLSQEQLQNQLQQLLAVSNRIDLAVARAGPITIEQILETFSDNTHA